MKNTTTYDQSLQLNQFFECLIYDIKNIEYISRFIRMYPGIINCYDSSNIPIFDKIFQSYIMSLSNSSFSEAIFYEHIIKMFIDSRKIRVSKYDIKSYKQNIALSKRYFERNGGSKFKRLSLFFRDMNTMLDGGVINQEISDINKKYDINPTEKEQIPIIYAPINGNYINLTHEKIFTIDNSDTNSFEDAISLKVLENGHYIVGVHITDPTEILDSNPELMDRAKKQGESIYIKDSSFEHNPMLPKELTFNVCSLIKGRKRPATSYLFEFEKVNETFKLVSFSTHRSFIEIKENFTYEEINKLLNSSETSEYKDIILTLIEIANCSRGRGLLPLIDANKLPKEIKVNDKKINTSALLIRIYAQIVNANVALTFEQQNLPLIYTVNSRVDSKKTMEQLLQIAKSNPVLLKFIKSCNDTYNPPTYSSTRKELINSNFLYYAGVTNPLRGFADLFNSRLVRKYLIENTRDEETILKDTSEVSEICTLLNETLTRNRLYMKDFMESEKHLDKQPNSSRILRKER